MTTGTQSQSLPAAISPDAARDDAGAPSLVLADLTTTRLAGPRSAGASRVESALAKQLLASHAGRVRLLSWSATDSTFVWLPPAVLGRPAARAPSAVAAAAADTPRVTAAEVRCGADGRVILLVTGSGWLSNGAYLRGLLDLRSALGAELHVVVHDLVHLKFPHWAPREDAARFGSHLEAMIAGADCVLAYSAATTRDLEAAARAVRLALPPVRPIALGADFGSAADCGDAAPPLARELAGRPFVAYVSTITFRKNHELVYNVWRQLAERLGDRLPVLLFVGRVAPDQEAFVDRATRDPLLAGHLRIVSGATDAELDWIYRNCLFTVFPSLYEGWGLPVAESLAHGKVCLASSAGAVPETAGSATPVLDPLDLAAWRDEAARLATDRDALARAEHAVRARYRPVSWAEAAASVWEAVSTALPISSVRPAPAVHLAVHTTGTTACPVVAAGWTGSGNPGLRSGARRSRIGLLLSSSPPHGVRLGLALRDLGGPDAWRLEIEVNGARLDAWNLAPPVEAVTRSVEVPPELLDRRGLLDLVLVASGSDTVPAYVLEAVRLEPLTLQEAEAAERRRARWEQGETYSFSAGARSVSLLGSGWGEPAFWGVWSVAPEATLTCAPFPPPAEPVVWRAAVRAFVWPQHPRIEVEVVANDAPVGRWHFEHPHDRGVVERVVTIPAELVQHEPVQLHFRIPGCISPRALGLSQDERRLGIGLVKAQWVTEAEWRRDPDWLQRWHGMPRPWR